MPNVTLFEEKLVRGIRPEYNANELAQCIVSAALETEYGRTFTLSPGFAKMAHTLAHSIVTNPELRRQALMILSFYLKQNGENQKSFA